MRIALLGYGKMGKAIEEVALSRGHTIVLKLDKFESLIRFNNADVAIDFSTPDAAFNNIKNALSKNIPVISGTTGWLNRYDEIVAICKNSNGGFIYASNFSLGVNLFFEINQQLAKLMQNFGYETAITEIHHTRKLDIPSGTAISLAEQILPYSNMKQWKTKKETADELQIHSKRIDDVTGTHIVNYSSNIDEIEIKHIAKNRLGFAQGAVLAAEFIKNKKEGVFTMKDVLGLVNK